METSNIFSVHRLHRPPPENVSRSQRVKSRHCALLRNLELPSVTCTKRSALSTTRQGGALMAAVPGGDTRQEDQEMGLATCCSRKTRPAASWLITHRALVLDGSGTSAEACCMTDRRSSWRRLGQIFKHSELASRETDTEIQFAVFLSHCKIKSKFHSGQHGRLFPEIRTKRLSTSKLQNHHQRNKADMGENLCVRVRMRTVR